MLHRSLHLVRHHARTLSTRARPREAPAPVPVDSDLLPLSSPYSLESLSPSSSSSSEPLSRATLERLHHLAALVPPPPPPLLDDASSCRRTGYLRGMDELVSIVQAVRHVDTSHWIPPRSTGSEPSLIDARVRVRYGPLPADPEPLTTASSTTTKTRRPEEHVEVAGHELLERAQGRIGRFFVAPMPDNIKKRKSSAAGSSDPIEGY
ncbi:hypothetical protein JCM10212_007165 [Sporobolomyces blumeae]